EPGNDDTITAYTIHWGDGHSDTFTGDPTADASRTHTYADGPNDYTIVVDLTDDDGAHSNTGNLAVHVDNVPPTIAVSGNAHVNDGSPYTLNPGAITDPGLDTVSAFRVNWGDGSHNDFTGIPTGLSKTHTYADGPNNYTIAVDLTDE